VPLQLTHLALSGLSGFTIFDRTFGGVEGTIGSANGTDFAFTQNGQIEAAATARMEPFRYIGTSELHAELITGYAGLCDFDQGAADAKSIADADGRFVQSFRREIFTEHPERQRHARKLGTPEGIML